MTDLPDVNVWLALSIKEHQHNSAATTYWTSKSEASVAFCALSAAGLTRLLTNPHVMDGKPLSVQEAWSLYRRWLTDPSVFYVPEVYSWTAALESILKEHRLTPRLLPDAFLAAFAISTNLRLVTFDRDFLRFRGLDMLLLEA